MKTGVWNLAAKLERIGLPDYPVVTSRGETFDVSDCHEFDFDDSLARAVVQCEWRVLRLLDTMMLQNVEDVNVLDELPTGRNVMVPTEEEKAQQLDAMWSKEETALAEAELVEDEVRFSHENLTP